MTFLIICVFACFWDLILILILLFLLFIESKYDSFDIWNRHVTVL